MSSSPEMVFAPRFSYQRLERQDNESPQYGMEERAIRRRVRNRFRYRVRIGRRFKVRIPNLRRFFRRKARVGLVKLTKVVRRLKEGKAHFGDLFAGNYMFMQVTPAPLTKCLDKKSVKPCLGHEVCHLGLPCSYSLGNGRLLH